MTANHTNGEACQIPLRRRDGTVAAWTLVDPEDYPALASRPWHLNTRGYAVRKPGRQTFYLHRVIMGLGNFCDDRREVDHINGDRLDNRRANLRVVSRSVQQQNQRSHRDARSRFRGVAWSENRQRWNAVVIIRGKSHWLGAFDNELDAARVADAFRLKHMPFALPDPALAEALAA